MKKSILVTCLFILGLGFSFEAKSQFIIPQPVIDAIVYWTTGCVNGGEGSGGCSISVSVSAGGSILGSGGSGGATITHSVSNCKDGYYACCNLLGANCKKEEEES